MNRPCFLAKTRSTWPKAPSSGRRLQLAGPRPRPGTEPLRPRCTMNIGLEQRRQFRLRSDQEEAGIRKGPPGDRGPFTSIRADIENPLGPKLQASQMLEEPPQVAAGLVTPQLKSQAVQGALNQVGERTHGRCQKKQRDSETTAANGQLSAKVSWCEAVLKVRASSQNAGPESAQSRGDSR